MSVLIVRHGDRRLVFQEGSGWSYDAYIANMKMWVDANDEAITDELLLRAILLYRPEYPIEYAKMTIEEQEAVDKELSK